MGAADAVVEVVLHRVQLPLRRPHRAAHGHESVRDVVLVEVTTASGVQGWGECSALSTPTYTGEYTSGAWYVLRDLLGPALLDERDAGIVDHPMASAAVRGAVADAELRRAGRSLTDRVAGRLGRPRAAVGRTAVLGLAPIEDLVAAVDARRQAGVDLVKLKVTPRPADLEAVAEVRRTFPGLPLAVDANGSLDPRSVAALDRHALVYIEQPAPADDLVVSAQYARRHETPIALDESIRSVGSVEAMAALGSGVIVNVKPARLGGIDAAVEVIQRAHDLGLGVFVGGMLETGVGRASALAVAASSACDLPTDLGPSGDYVEEDLTAPILTDDDGRLVVPTGVGIGVTPDPVALDRFRRERLVLS